MLPGVLTGIGGDAVSYPPPDFWAPTHEPLWSRGAVVDVRLDRPLHLPSIPPARRRVPFKCPGAGARSRGWRCGCRSTRAHRSPRTSQVTVQSQRRRRTSKGRASRGSRLPAVPMPPGPPTKVGLGAAGKGRRVERECNPSEERGLGAPSLERLQAFGSLISFLGNYR